GMIVERRAPEHGIDGGLALWRLAPRADFAGWQATAMGLGRDDASSGEVAIRSAWACGVRLGAAVRWSALSLRVEGVQWVPLRIDRGLGSESASGGRGGGGAGSSPHAGGGA